MSFHSTSENIRLENRHDLVANVQRADRSWQESRLNLDDFIGNSDGWFVWDGKNFSHSSRNVTLSHRPDGYWLEGELTCKDGGYRERQGINLSEKIANHNGNLTYRR